MKMTQENMKRFEDMIRNFADENNLHVKINQEFNENRSRVEFKLLEQNCSLSAVVYWDTKKSLTDACTALFMHVTREWNLDGAPIPSTVPEIKNVVFNNPATIVLWEDGTKTVVKCQDGDLYSEETGLALCIAKKALGNKPNFNNIFKKWIPDDWTTTATTNIAPLAFSGLDKSIKDDFINALGKRIEEALRKPWKPVSDV